MYLCIYSSSPSKQNVIYCWLTKVKTLDAPQRDSRKANATDCSNSVNFLTAKRPTVIDLEIQLQRLFC